MFQIVIAEDNPTDVYLLREALTLHSIGCSINVFPTGDKLMRYLDEAGCTDGPPCPDLVILDWHLPFGDGVSIIKKVVEHRICEETPVVVLTSSASPKDKQEALRAGADDYIQKPSGLAEFLDIGRVVRSYVDKKAASNN